jgi:hypothetical protein
MTEEEHSNLKSQIVISSWEVPAVDETIRIQEAPK